MVYIDITNEHPSVFIPANDWKYEGVGLALSVKNTTDGQVLEMPIVSSNAAGFLVCIQLQLPDGFHAGEWQYKLTGTGGFIATGLLVAFDGERTPAVQYNSENNVIQYGG